MNSASVCKMFILIAKAANFYCAAVTSADPLKIIESLNSYHPAKTPLIYSLIHVVEMPSAPLAIYDIMGKMEGIDTNAPHAEKYAKTPGESYLYFTCEDINAIIKKIAKPDLSWLEGKKVRHSLGRSQISGIVRGGIVHSAKGDFAIGEICEKHREICAPRDRMRKPRFSYEYVGDVTAWLEIE